MKNKITAFILSLFITVVSVLLIFYIEQKVFNPEGTTEVYVVNKEKLDKGYVIDEENFDNLFKLEKRRTDQIIDASLKSKEDAYNYYIKQDMYKNEILSINKLGSLDNEFKDMVDKREVTISASSSANVVAGRLREGDRVDLIVTYKKGPNVTTETPVKNMYISKVYTSDGALISKDDKNKVALTITFILDGKDAETMESSLASGSWSLVKVLED